MNIEDRINELRREEGVILARIEELENCRKYIAEPIQEGPVSERPSDMVQKKRTGKVWSEKIIDFLRKKGPKCAKDEMCKILKERFNIKVNENALANVYYRFKISCLRKSRKGDTVGEKKTKKERIKKWTDEIVDFLKANSDIKPLDMPKEIKKKFGVNFSVEAIRMQRKVQGIAKRGKKTKKTKKCEECRDEFSVAWSKGRRLCKKCFDLETRGPVSVQRREKAGEYGDEADVDLGPEEEE